MKIPTSPHCAILTPPPPPHPPWDRGCKAKGRQYTQTPGQMREKKIEFRTDKFINVKQTEVLINATHLNGLASTIQNFRMFHVSNLPVPNFRICPLTCRDRLLTLSGRYGRQQVCARRATRQRVLARLRGVGDEGAAHQGEGAEEAARLLQLRQVVDGQRQLWREAATSVAWSASRGVALHRWVTWTRIIE